jgi:ubiquinone/menaquinone biosynthesis C-methylase UbiE
MGEVRSPSEDLTNEAIFELITDNPWDDNIYKQLSERAKTEAFRYPTSWMPEPDLYNSISGQGLIKLAEGMKKASSLEAKYRLLAGQAEFEQNYTRWFKRTYGEDPQPLTWYDVIQGRQYNVCPPKEDKDPFESYPDSVMSALSETIGQSLWGKAVDLGSGTGDTTKAIADRANSIISLDRFDFLHKIARSKFQNRDNILYVVADATALPFKSEASDLVVSNGLTAFIPKDRLGLFSQEIARVIGEGGSYFEPMVLSEEKLWKTIKGEYLNSAKGLLAYMIGELVTSPGEGKSGDYPHSFKDTDESYKRAGLSSMMHRFSSGVVVCEYFKAPRVLKTDLDECIQNGEGVRASNSVTNYLDRGRGKGDVLTRIRAIEKLAKLSLKSLRRQGNLDAEFFVQAFIQPLAGIVGKKALSETEDEQLRKVYSHNVMTLRSFIDEEGESDFMQKGMLALAAAYKAIKNTDGWEQEAYLTKVTLPDTLREVD